MNNLTPQAEEQLIQKLISLKLVDAQFNSLTRSIGIEPSTIFSNHFTNVEKAEVLVNRANQLGCYKELEYELDNNLFTPYTTIPTSTVFDNNLAFDFGLLYEELLTSIPIESNHITPTNNSGFFEHIEFRAKLRFKAKFKPSTRKTAIIYKNDNSVLQRKAQKLGFNSYYEIEIKVSQLYQEILARFPVEDFPAEVRLSILLNNLFGSLPESLRTPKTTSYLYGIIFGTAAQCLIFNE